MYIQMIIFEARAPANTQFDISSVRLFRTKDRPVIVVPFGLTDVEFQKFNNVEIQFLVQFRMWKGSHVTHMPLNLAFCPVRTNSIT